MIKLAIFDVDGVLTTGHYIASVSTVNWISNSFLSKSFYTRDFHGLRLLHEAGIKVLVVSASDDVVIKEQCYRAADFVTICINIKNKKKFIENDFIEYEPENISYVGDDVMDLDLLSYVGFAACPSDAHEKVIDLVSKREEKGDGMICNFGGGKGCVREVCDYILN